MNYKNVDNLKVYVKNLLKTIKKMTPYKGFGKLKTPLTKEKLEDIQNTLQELPTKDK